MTVKEYKQILKYELYNDQHLSIINRIRIKFFQPNTNCVYLARRMWYLFSRGKVGKALSKYYYLKILHKYGCCIYRNITVGKGFQIAHPVGIVLGRCVIGDNFTIYQNTTIGIRHPKDEENGRIPKIGNNVILYAGSMILGGLSICDNVSIGANSVVVRSINEEGVYCGNPAEKKR